MTRPVGVLLVLVCLGVRETWAQAMGRPICPTEVGSRCQYLTGYSSYYTYMVEGQSLKIQFSDGVLFGLECGNVMLDSRALPRFESTVLVREIILNGCTPPAVSYEATLAVLNVSVSANAVLHLDRTPATPQLNAAHFSGLHNLITLRLCGSHRLGTKLQKPAPGFLNETRLLRSLLVYETLLTSDVLEWLPASLSSLKLIDNGVKRITATVLRRLPRLEELKIRENHLVEVEAYAAPMLRIFRLEAPNANVISSKLPSTLETFCLYQSHMNKPWAKCDALNELLIESTKVEALPARWVASCANLTKLTVGRAKKLVHLSPKLLEDAWQLRYLKITKTELKKLPSGLLNNTPNLSYVDFSDNKIQSLPRYFFLTTSSLQTLKLDRNRFTEDVLYELQSLKSLQTLSLEGNTNINDVCNVIGGKSPLWQLRNLTSLSLKRTGITSVCFDWREEMPYLRKLDLSYTKITSLTYIDLQYVRAIPDALVDLTGANVTRVFYSFEEYREAMEPAVRSQANIKINSILTCDCKLYWTARAMYERSEHAIVHTLRCIDNEFSSPPFDELVCAASDMCAQLPPECHCVMRNEGTVNSTRLVTVNCERAGLEHPPSPLPLNSSWRFLLANNSIRKLHLTDLPREMHNLRELDLRDNGLQNVDGEVVAALIAVPDLKVRLAGNPLICDCTAEPLLVAVRAHPGAFDSAARCQNGSALSSLSPQQCADVSTGTGSMLTAALIAPLAVIAAAALVLTMCLLRLEHRLWLKAVLHRWGWLPRAAEPEDGRRFDAFVSFSHHDAEFVSKLVARLEGGRTPYRLCLHDRDWAPGEWIPAQIAASVRASRRTIAIVSRHFLRSKWARAEFREAHAQALRSVMPRLVVVLLEAPAALPLDKESRAYLARNTYVQWGDRWFWDKLLLAMPPPRVINPPASDLAPKHTVPLLSDHKPTADLSAAAPNGHLSPGSIFLPSINKSEIM